MKGSNRRRFIKTGTQISGGLILSPWILSACTSEEKQETVAENNTMDLFFNISLAQWSLHKTLFAKEMDNLDFAVMAKNEFGIGAVEYVNQFFKDKAKDMAYLGQMKQIAADHGVENVLIMIDGEGGLGNSDEAARNEAVENHYKWVEAAKFLGCHSIRVNAYGEGSAEEVAAAAVDGLGKLTEFASTMNINVIVENHGGYSSDGSWLAGVISQVGNDHCGTLPDFGNFCITRGDDGCEDSYDRYKGVLEMMPFAKGVSAKSHDFNPAGDEIHTDYLKMLNIVKEAGYTGYIGIEYEGSELGEKEGIKKTKALLEKVGAQIA